MATDALFQALADLVAREAQTELVALCRLRAEEIRGRFSEWKQVPADIRSQPEAVQRYASTIISVAQTFASALGDTALLDALSGPPADNPIAQWNDALKAARSALDDHDYERAATTIRETLARTSGLSGTGADQLRAISIGLLGQVCFHRGDVDEAVEHFDHALSRCVEMEDVEGEAVYLAALYEAHRWLDAHSTAAGFASRLATLHGAGTAEQAHHWQARAAAARAGQPRVQVWVEHDGGRLDPDNLPVPLVPQGSLRFVFERDRISLAAVTQLVERGRALGEGRQFDAAIKCFEEAARLDPNDPASEYSTGQTLMHQRRWSEAAAAYRRTEAIAPGWYHCRTDRWLAEQLAEGRLSEDVFDTLVRLEACASAEEGAAHATEAAERWPDVAPIRLALSKALLGVEEKEAARVAAEAGVACAMDDDVKTRLLVQLAQLVPEAEGRELLRDAVALGGNRVARAMAQVLLAM